MESSKSKPLYEDLLKGYDHAFSGIRAACTGWPKLIDENSHATPSEIKNSVLNSASVQKVICEIHVESGQAREDIEKEGMEIITKLSHDFQPRSYRSLLFIVLKVLKNLFEQVNIDVRGFENLQSLLKDNRVVLLPTHRSYVDFLLISAILFLKKIPIPVVASAEDFLNMTVFGHAIRETGGFFIRRGIDSNDKLYWAILTEFVQQVVINGHHPLKYYIEGTRSRTGKSLMPKTGLLRMVAELYVKRHVSDVLIVPIAISYDRTVEENLFAQELLGIPKPKESTRKLFSALSILRENYGSVHLSVGEPISIHEFWKRSQSPPETIIPRQIQTMSQRELNLVKDLASWIVKKNLNNVVVCSFNIVAFVYIKYLQLRRLNIQRSKILSNYIWVKRLLKQMGYIVCANEKSSEKEILQTMKIHRNVIRVEDERMDLVKSENIPLTHILPQNLASEAVPSTIITYYANQVLQLLITPCLMMFLSTSVPGISLSLQTLEKDVLYLSKLLCRDFVHVPELFLQEFQRSMNALLREKIIDQSGDNLKFLDLEKAEMLSSIVLPLFIIRRLVCNACEFTSDFKTVVDFCLKSGRILIEKGFFDYRLVSKEMISNAISSLVDCKVITQSDRISKQLKLGENFKRASEKLGHLLKGHKVVHNTLLSSRANSALQSKL